LLNSEWEFDAENAYIKTMRNVWVEEKEGGEIVNLMREKGIDSSYQRYAKKKIGTRVYGRVRITSEDGQKLLTFAKLSDQNLSEEFSKYINEQIDIDEFDEKLFSDVELEYFDKEEIDEIPFYNVEIDEAEYVTAFDFDYLPYGERDYLIHKIVYFVGKVNYEIAVDGSLNDSYPLMIKGYVDKDQLIKRLKSYNATQSNYEKLFESEK